MNAAVQHCHCCGQPLPAGFGLRWDENTRTVSCEAGQVGLTKTEAKVFRAVYRRGRAAPIDDREGLMALAFGDDADGGPDSLNTVAVHIAHIRKKLRPIGWTVTLSTGQPRRGYRLIPLAADKSRKAIPA